MVKKRKYAKRPKKLSPEQKVLIDGEENETSVVNAPIIWSTKSVLILLGCIFFTAMLSFFAVTYGVEKGLTGYAIIDSETAELQQEKYLSREQIEHVINTSSKYVEEMNNAGFSTYYVTDILLDMKDEASDTKIDYEKILANAALISKAREDAFYVYDLLTLKEIEIIEFEQISGINASSAWQLYNNAQTEFENERYENAKEALNAITPKLDQIQVDATRLTTQLLAQKNRFMEWVKNNVISIVLTIFVIAGLALFFYKKMEISLIQRKITHLQIEQEVLADLMKRAQKEYYNDGKITKSMYTMKTELYKNRTEEIKTTLPILQRDLLKKMKKESVMQQEVSKQIIPFVKPKKSAKKKKKKSDAVEKESSKEINTALTVMNNVNVEEKDTTQIDNLKKSHTQKTLHDSFSEIQSSSQPEVTASSIITEYDTALRDFLERENM